MNSTHYEAQQINDELVGYKIVQAIQSPCGEYFGFRAVKGKKEIGVWVDRDAEGNGPGHLSIQQKP